MSFIKEFEQRKTEADGIIAEICDGLSNVPEPLQSSMKYSLSSGGKRLRPILFLETYRLLGGVLNAGAKKLAAAIECVHTYSLIHDDLPCMDNDDFRRGKPTNHKVYGEGIAVLAGDALLNLAFELTSEAVIDSGCNKGYARAANTIAKLAGKEGMIAGQALDIYSKNDIMTPEKLEFIYKHKTGDLMCAAVESAALITEGGGKETDALIIFAKNYGFAFQIKDDIDDYEKKIKHEVKNYVDIFGIANAKKALNEKLNTTLNALGTIKGDTAFLKKLIKNTL